MADRSEPLVSVVTPFYNTAEYLPECVESVIEQSYGNWEYILVDNCSDDGSAEIAEEFAAEDSRIRVVHNNEFLDQIENYNRALSLISDESVYTKVVEADNWIYPRCLSRMVGVAEEHPRVALVSAYCTTEDSLRFLDLPLDVNVMDGREAARMHFLEDAYLFGAPTTVLMRSELVRDRTPFYDETTWLVKDLDACYEILREWDFGFVHQVLTFVRTRNESIQSGRESYYAMALDRLAVLLRHGPDFLDPGEYREAYRRTEKVYYSRLAWGAITGRRGGFWDYHRSGLSEIGKELSYPKLAGHVLREFLYLAVNPGATLMMLYRHLRSRIGASDG